MCAALVPGGLGDKQGPAGRPWETEPRSGQVCDCPPAGSGPDPASPSVGVAGPEQLCHLASLEAWPGLPCAGPQLGARGPGDGARSWLPASGFTGEDGCCSLGHGSLGGPDPTLAGGLVRILTFTPEGCHQGRRSPRPGLAGLWLTEAPESTLVGPPPWTPPVECDIPWSGGGGPGHTNHILSKG